MPIADWQFWVVTLVALWGLWCTIRLIVPRRSDRGCSSCGSTRKREAHVGLTVERRRIGQ